VLFNWQAVLGHRRADMAHHGNERVASFTSTPKNAVANRATALLKRGAERKSDIDVT